MEVLRDCQSPIELNSFESEMNNVDVEINCKVLPEKQAMIPAEANEKNSVHNNNNHARTEGLLASNVFSNDFICLCSVFAYRKLL